jgi:putative SbcD/Mre11-related phosphoesterase
VGPEWLFTPERVAVHLPTATAVLADVHLGYDRARQNSGEAVPSVPLDEHLKDLEVACAYHAVRRLVIAGDLLENAHAFEVLTEFADWLRQSDVELTAVVPGNHDRGLSPLTGIPLYPEGYSVGRWLIVHGDGRLPPHGHVVHGHFHPCLRSGPPPAAACFLIRQRRIVLPAYSPDAAGANVVGVARWRGYRCAAIVGKKVLDFGEVTRLQRTKRGRTG